MSSQGSGHAIGQGWVVTSVASQPLRLELRLHGPGEARIVLETNPDRCYRRVRDVGVSYRGREGGLPREAADAVADWLEARELPLREALLELLPRPVELGADAARWPRAVEAHPPGTGFSAPPVDLTRPGAFVGVRRAARTVALHDGRLTDLPVCLGGHPSVLESLDPRCRGCEDAPACAGPPRWLDASATERLRPSPRRDGGEQLRDAIAAIGYGTDEASAPLGTLLEHVGDGPYDNFELSYKIGTAGVLRGPRVTCYLPPGRSEVAARGFVALSPASVARSLAERLRPVAEGLPWHFGFDPGPQGVSAKLYLSTSAADGQRVRAILGALGPLRGIDRFVGMPVFVIGVAVRPSGHVRVRVYPRVERADASDDPTADPHGSAGWSLSEHAEPVLEGRYAHYHDSQLTWSGVVERLALESEVADQLGRGFQPEVCRYYFLQLGHGAGTVTVYAQVGPHPRDV